MASGITGVSIVYSTICSGGDKKKKHESSSPLSFVWGKFTGGRWIPRTEGQQRGQKFPLDDVIMHWLKLNNSAIYYFPLLPVTFFHKSGEDQIWSHRGKFIFILFHRLCWYIITHKPISKKLILWGAVQYTVMHRISRKGNSMAELDTDKLKRIDEYYNKNPCAWFLWHWYSWGQLALCNPRGR